MYSIQETFRNDALAKLNSSILNAQKFAENMLEMAREIGDLNLRTGKAGADAVSSAARKMLGATNPAEFLALAASVARPDLGVMHAYAEQLGGIASRRLVALPVFPPLTTQAQAVSAIAATVAEPVAAPEAPEATQEALAAVAVEASSDLPAATPSIAEPADSTLAESVALDGAVVNFPAPEAAAASAEAAPAEMPQPPAQAPSPKVADEVLAEAALPADGASAPARIVKKAAASPTVLKAGVAESKARDARKAPRATMHLKNNAATPANANAQKTKKRRI